MMHPDCEGHIIQDAAVFSIWAWLWIIWLVSFVIIELLAARKGGVTTLSEHIWKWLGVKGNMTGKKRVFRWLLRAGLVVLTLHLGWGWP